MGSTLQMSLLLTNKPEMQSRWPTVGREGRGHAKTQAEPLRWQGLMPSGMPTSPSPEAKAKMTWGTQNGLFREAKLLKDEQDSGFDVKVTPTSCVHLLSQPSSNAGVGGTTNRPCRARFLSHFSTQDIRNTQWKLLSTYKE